MIAAAALAGAPATARNPATDNPAWTYVQARAAAMSGEHRRSAELLAALAEMNANDTTINRKALAEAISAGNMELALRLACEPGAREAARREILRASPALFDRPDAGACLGEALLGIAAQR